MMNCEYIVYPMQTTLTYMNTQILDWRCFRPRLVQWMALFSWVPIFVDLTKMTHSWGSKFVAIVFSFIIHTESNPSWVLEFVDPTLCENHENWYPMKFKPGVEINFPTYWPNGPV